MRITSLVLLAAGFLSACIPGHVVSTPAPTPVAGERIRYAGILDTSEFIQARLVSVDADSLVFERLVTGWGKGSGVWARGSVSTDSIGRLQVRVGRRSNGGRGALIGVLVGGGLGLACAATTEGGWMEPTPEQCMLGYTLMGAGTGFLIGALIRSDIWAPSPLPRRKPAPAPLAIGIRTPL